MGGVIEVTQKSFSKPEESTRDRRGRHAEENVGWTRRITRVGPLFILHLVRPGPCVLESTGLVFDVFFFNKFVEQKHKDEPRILFETGNGDLSDPNTKLVRT